VIRPDRARGAKAALCGWGILWLALGPAASRLAAERVVAIGDVHGAYEEFVGILQAAGIIDKNLVWTGSKTILVQTGDAVDRGPRSREVLNLLMDLSEKAPQQGGEVRALLGNHETMVMMGDMRYVSADDYRSFATPDSEALRQKELENYTKYRKRRPARSGAPKDSGPEAWLSAHPAGFFEIRREFAPRGKYGRWLRERDAVTQIGETIFLHGGLSPQLTLKSVKEINERLRRELTQMDDLWAKLASRGILWPYATLEEAQAEAMIEWKALEGTTGAGDPDLLAFLSLSKTNIASPTGPLWYRGMAQEPEAEFAPRLGQILKRFKARSVVIGHTVSPAKRITSRFDGRVIMIDTGMLASYFQGRASALEMQDGQLRGIYMGEPAQSLTANGK